MDRRSRPPATAREDSGRAGYGNLQRQASKQDRSMSKLLVRLVGVPRRCAPARARICVAPESTAACRRQDSLRSRKQSTMPWKPALTRNRRRASIETRIHASPASITIRLQAHEILGQDHVAQANGRQQVKLHAEAIRAEDVVERSNNADEDVGNRAGKKISRMAR